MKPIIEEKLRELYQLSLAENDPQTHVVIHLLLAHKPQNTAGEFAKHCCAHKSVAMSATVKESSPDDEYQFPEWIN